MKPIFWTCLWLLAALLPQQNLFAQDEVPDVNAFIFVDEEPVPTNLNEVRGQMIYPEDAIQQGITGTVVARVLVGADGTYQQHKIVKAIHPSLAAAVSAKLPELAFTPAKIKGEPTMYWINMPFPFRLVDEREENIKAKIEELTDQLTGEPDNHEFWHKRGVQRSELGQYEDALIDFDESLELNPRKNKKKLAKSTYEYLFYSHYARAAVLSNLNRFDSAIVDYTSALKIAEEMKAPDSTVEATISTVYLERGYNQSLKEDYEAAKVDYRWVLANDTSLSCTVYPLLADLLLAEEVPGELVPVYSGLIDCQPENEMLYYSRGYYRLESGDAVGSVSDFGVVVERSSNQQLTIAAYNQAGRAYFEQEKYEQALQEIQGALDINALNPLSYYYRGLVEFAQGKEEEACESVRKSLSFGMDGENKDEAVLWYNEHCGTWDE
jgi:tetratricopeptide (TPR) repeat protein